MEVCGFNDWLIRLLRDYRCHKVILIQPEERKKRKTDRRDAAALSELLWVNRDRFLAGKPVRGLRQVEIASTPDQENRRLTTLRKETSQTRTRIVNKIKHMLRRHNLQWHLPTKTFPTQGAIAWLKQLVLSEIDRLEMDYLIADLERAEQQVQELEQAITMRCANNQTPTGKPVMITLDDLDDFGGYIAAEVNHCDDNEKQKKLDAVFEKIQSVMDKYTDEEPPQTIKIEDGRKDKVISAQAVQIAEFAAQALMAAEQLRIKKKPLANFWLAPEQRDVLLLIPGLSKTIKNNLAKEKPVTVVEVASMTMAVAEDLPDGEPQKQMALLLVAKHLLDRLQEGIMAKAEPPAKKKPKRTAQKSTDVRRGIRSREVQSWQSDQGNEEGAVGLAGDVNTRRNECEKYDTQDVRHNEGNVGEVAAQPRHSPLVRGCSRRFDVRQHCLE